MTDSELYPPAGPTSPVAGSAPKPTDGRSPTRTAVEWIAVIVGALAVALVVKTFLLQAFYIPSPSMEPTLQVGDRVLVNKLDDSPERGDIVVFERPDESTDGINDLIKRVIGLPGESVEGRDGQVLVDGVPLPEPYLPDGVITKTFGPVDIPAGHIFVMGDNRPRSKDSTVFGPIPIDSVVGRAFVVIWPVSEVGGL